MVVNEVYSPPSSIVNTADQSMVPIELNTDMSHHASSSIEGDCVAVHEEEVENDQAAISSLPTEEMIPGTAFAFQVEKFSIVPTTEELFV
jgi:hypothetical protein